MIKDQPAPKPTDRKPVWPMVIEDIYSMAKTHSVELVPDNPIMDVIKDMQDRDSIGQTRYGVRLTSHNGRNHLIDAYQEMLDALVYLRAHIDEVDNIQQTEGIQAMYKIMLGQTIGLGLFIHDK